MEVRGAATTKAINIISGLRDSLNPSVDSNLPYDLDRLYDYMQRRILEAHAQNDVAALSEVVELLRTLKSGWDGIANPGVDSLFKSPSLVLIVNLESLITLQASTL
jgi:flagellar protein FliS